MSPTHWFASLSTGANDADGSASGAFAIPAALWETQLDGLITRLRESNVLHLRLGLMNASEHEYRSRIAGQAADPQGIEKVVAEILELARGVSLEIADRLGAVAWDDRLPRPPAHLLAYADAGLQREVVTPLGTNPSVLDATRTVAAIRTAFLLHLQELLAPSLAQRMHELSKASSLEGDTGEARFRSFQHWLDSAEGLLDFGLRFPGALHLAWQTIGHWRRAVGEMLSRYLADAEEIEIRLLDNSTGQPRSPVVSALGPLGDLHHRGRAVYILEQADGRRVVYKPRNLSSDAALRVFVDWLGREGFAPALHCHGVILRKDYGWSEYVPHLPARDDQEIGDFFARQGGYLALLYVLGGYDFFCENILASGAHPHLIDAECLCSPRLPDLNGTLFASVGRSMFEDSVIRVGFLPSWTWGDGVEAGVNMGAFSDVEGQLFPHDVPEWEFGGTDALRQTRIRTQMEASNSHLPFIHARHVAANAHTARVLAGFSEAYRLLLNGRDRLGPDSAPSMALADCELRAVLRNTRDYAQLIREMTHPEVSGSLQSTTILTEHLWRSHCPRYTLPVIASELSQLWRGDVPMFRFRGDSRALFDDDGDEIESSYVSESAVEGFQRRLARLSESDLALQTRIIERAFSIVDVPEYATSDGLLSIEVQDSEHLSLDATASRRHIASIADRLVSTSVSDGDTISWLGLSMGIDGRWQQTSLDGSLYDGTLGIALFLLYAAEYLDDSRLRIAADTAFETAVLRPVSRAREAGSRVRDWMSFAPSAFELPGAGLYLAAHFDAVRGTRHLARVLPTCLEWYEYGIDKRGESDIVSGSAGNALLLAQLSSLTRDPSIASLTDRFARRLLDASQVEDGMRSWRNPLFDAPLRGFTHGAAGAATALAAAFTVTGDAVLRTAAIEALRFDSMQERQATHAESARDERTLQRDLSWCHGAAGRSLGRLLISDCLAFPHLADEARGLLEAMVPADEQSDCLCHGAFGSIDVMLIGERVRPSGLGGAAKGYLGRILADAAARGSWRCGVPGRDMSLPGLFMGLAGIGMGLLRAEMPDRVPSPLHFALPPTTSSW